MPSKKKKSLVGWTDREFFSLCQNFNCYGEHYTQDIYDKMDTFIQIGNDRKDAIKVRITIEKI